MKLIEQYKDEWAEDSKINQLKLFEESARVPVLHSKWLNRLVDAKYKLRKAETSYRKIKHDREFFMITANKEIAEKYGWEPIKTIDGNKKVLKTALDRHMKNDPVMVDLELTVGVWNDIVDYLQAIVQHINNRSFIIKNMIEEKKFEQGIN